MDAQSVAQVYMDSLAFVTGFVYGWFSVDDGSFVAVIAG
jgi:hypothetical protein